MSGVGHHIPEALVADYASGKLSHPHALVAAAHISRCDECRAVYEAHLAVGGTAMETIDPVAMSNGARDAIMALLDDEIDEPPAPTLPALYPEPLSAYLGADGPQWKGLGFGIKQAILWEGEEGSARLISIDPGTAVPDHGHDGLEMTLVLQGSFSDAHGEFCPGDISVVNGHEPHQPVAGEGEVCICLASTDAPLKFSGLVPRMVQPLLRI